MKLEKDNVSIGAGMTIVFSYVDNSYKYDDLQCLKVIGHHWQPSLPTSQKERTNVLPFSFWQAKCRSFIVNPALKKSFV